MRYAFCVLGWHYYEEFYRALHRIAGDKHVINHRDEAFVAATSIYPLIRDDVRTMPNRGLDFGGYHQFNEAVDLAPYDFVVYCHDDLIIRDEGFVAELCRRFEEPQVMVIGNGYNGKDAEFRFGKYRKRMLWEDDDDFLVRTVRGSFFAARTEVFQRIGNFPVHWGASAERMRSGNVSLRNFAYIVTKTFGIESVTYLDPERWLETRYLIEMRRGERVPAAEVSHGRT